MMPSNLPMKQLNTRSRNVWLAAFLLAILVLVSAAVVGSCLYAYVHQSDRTISLYDGDITMTAQKTPNLSASVQAQGIPTVQSSATQYQGGQAKQQAAKYAFEVEDTQQIWQTDTAVELFKSSYANENGDVTVQSADNGKVIAPGTSGKYTFTLKNTGNKAADYKVWVETAISSEITKLPFEIKMSGNGDWLLGNKNSWEQVSNLDGVSVTEHVAAGKSVDYTFYWQWPFEQGNDAADTLLGNTGDSTEGGQNLTYTVTIHTIASESTNQADNDDQNGHHWLKPAKTGDTTPVVLWIAVLVGSICLIGLIILLKNKKEKNS